MSRREYFSLCMLQSPRWLTACAANPNPYMSATHVALVRLALRKKGTTR